MPANGRPPDPRPPNSDVWPIVAIAGRALVAVVVLFTVYAAVPLAGGNRSVGIVLGGLVLVGTLPVLFRRVRAIARSPHPVVEAVAAVVMTLTLLVVGSAAIYYTMAMAWPGAFNGLETKLDAVYFAVVVLSTVGFGDITPASQGARLAVTVNLALTVALLGGSLRLVGWAAKQGLGRQRGAEPVTPESGDGPKATGPGGRE